MCNSLTQAGLRPFRFWMLALILAIFILTLNLSMNLNGGSLAAAPVQAAGTEAALGGSQPLSFQAGDVTVETMAVDYTFAQRLTFRLLVHSQAAVASAQVFFQANSGRLHNGLADLSQVDSTTQALFTHDLQNSALPPFSTLTYWWEVNDVNGQTQALPPQTVSYLDNRRAWRSAGDDHLQVHWYNGDSAFGQSALTLALEALPRLNQEMGTDLPARVDIYIYDSVDELRSALTMAGRAWQGGQARPDLGVVLIAVAPGPDAQIDLQRDLAHELTHLLTYQAVGGASGKLPRWLDEGLAMLNEGIPDPLYQTTLATAIHNGGLARLESLCAPFSDEPQAAWLAYAQSQSVVTFIREQYGDNSLRTLLAAYRDGASCASGVERGLGLRLEALEAAWLAHIKPRPTWQARLESVAGWVVLAALLLMAPLPVVLLRRRA